MATPSAVKPALHPHPGNIARKAEARQHDPAIERQTRPGVSLSNALRKRQADADRITAHPDWHAKLDHALQNKERAFEAIDGGVRLVDIEDRQCRWPHGPVNSDVFRFCGEARDGLSPYCPRHSALAYNSAPRRALQAADA